MAVNWMNFNNKNAALSHSFKILNDGHERRCRLQDAAVLKQPVLTGR
jgi:hypothetical protein